jgi:hypothetical protein
MPLLVCSQKLWQLANTYYSVPPLVLWRYVTDHLDTAVHETGPGTVHGNVSEKLTVVQKTW